MGYLKVNGLDIHLAPGAKVKHVINSSIFLDDGLEGDYSYPFFIPLARNETSFGFLNLPQSINFDVEYQNAEYIDEGITVIRGTLIIKNSNANGYNAHLLANLGELALIRKKKLNEFNLGGQTPIPLIAQRRIIHFSGASSGLFTFILLNQTVSVSWAGSYPSTITALASAINATTFPGGVTVTATLASSDYMQVDANWTGSSPVLNAGMVIAGTGGSWSITLDRTGQQNTAQEWRTFLAGIISGFYPAIEEKMCFPVVLNQGSGIKKWNSGAGQFEERDYFYQNYYDHGDGYLFIPDPTSTATINELRTAPTPFIKVIWLINQFLQQLGYTAQGDILSDTELKLLCLYSNIICAEENYVSLVGYNMDLTEHYSLENHVPPQSTFAELLNAFRKLFCVNFFVNSFKKTFTFKTFNELLDQVDAVDYSHLVHPDKIQNFETALTGRKLSFSFDPMEESLEDYIKTITNKNILPDVNTYADTASLDTGRENIVLILDENNLYYPKYDAAGIFDRWDFYCHNLIERIIDSGEPQTETGCDSLYMSTHVDNIGLVAWRTPATKTKLGSYTFPLINSPDERENKSRLRFMFYRGMQNDASSKPYPLASHDDTKYGNTQISGTDYCLQWYGYKNLYDKFWSRFIEFTKTARQVEMLWNLTILDYLNIDLSRKVYINGVHYFIKSIEIEFPINNPARVVLVRI